MYKLTIDLRFNSTIVICTVVFKMKKVARDRSLGGPHGAVAGAMAMPGPTGPIG